MSAYDYVLRSIELVGTLAFAASGFMEGVRKRLDVVGVFVVAFVTAFGGGTMRDILLDRRPFFWVQQQQYVWLLLVLTMAAVPAIKSLARRVGERAIQYPDAVGLGLFTASGTMIAWQAQLPAIVAVMMGVVTGVFGGVARDVICNEIPTVFRDRQPYAICAFAGCWLTVGLAWANADPIVAIAMGATLTAALRLLSLWRRWELPSVGGGA